MKAFKVLLCSLIGLLLLILLIGGVGSLIMSNSTVDNMKGSNNIDSLLPLIWKDTVYHIADVSYNRNDSSLLITVSDKNAFYNYFNEAYKFETFANNEVVKIQDKYKREISITSKKADRLIKGFQNGWCIGNVCYPLRKAI